MEHLFSLQLHNRDVDIDANADVKCEQSISTSCGNYTEYQVSCLDCIFLCKIAESLPGGHSGSTERSTGIKRWTRSGCTF